ncbi:uncharacterized protein LY89DRAFT_692665 [Mollisia scopiformis]|uniref:Uncharacterized protein n=1 Tax=Mollisia scopiformis TaxID=149040 RepID=A0A132B1G6_MOLSC|nr:uncharacterized protein LY89DRAFT_692665 [Mollisia scopiformis]KUJ06151.1 hypothetical protein LY89DRAFT_692665 [Mollisia scopiformis]
MSSSQEKQIKSSRARAEAKAEAEAEVDNNPSFSSELEFLEDNNNNELEHFESNNQFEHHTTCVSPNNSSTDFVFDDNTEDEKNAKQVMDAFMEALQEERKQERGERGRLLKQGERERDRMLKQGDRERDRLLKQGERERERERARTRRAKAMVLHRLAFTFLFGLGICWLPSLNLSSS